MTILGKVVKNGMKVVGTASKIGIEATADIFGIVRENISKQEGEKDKFAEKGKNLGTEIKSNIDKAGESAEVVVNKGVEITSEVAKKVTSSAINTINNLVKNSDGTKYKNYNKQSNESEYFTQKAKVVDTDFVEVKKDMDDTQMININYKDKE